MTMDTTVEDPSKKRDSAQVEHGEEEKSKKVRVIHAERHRSPTRRLVVREPRTQEASPASNASERSATTSAQEQPSQAIASGNAVDAASEGVSFAATSKIWDLESALLYIVQVDGEGKEYLSNSNEPQSPWLTFRVGHAGDASTITQLYRRVVAPNENPELEIATTTDTTTDSSPDDDDPRSSMLEVWLAEGLGDEDTPPAVHALLGHLHRNEGETISSSLAAVALLALDWDAGERILRVQWMHIDPSLHNNIAQSLEQRTWLRISTLAQMTACQAVAIDKELTQLGVSEEENGNTKDHPSPSAE